MSTHTPGPWMVKGRYYGQQFRAETIEPNICEMSSSLPPEEVSNNAAFIVRACNSHEAMLEALKRFAQAIKADNYDQDLLVDIYHDVREAIRLAEGRG